MLLECFVWGDVTQELTPYTDINTGTSNAWIDVSGSSNMDGCNLMPSSYSNLGIEKIDTGEQSGVWGNTTNANFDILDDSISGVFLKFLPAT